MNFFSINESEYFFSFWRLGKRTFLRTSSRPAEISMTTSSRIRLWQARTLPSPLVMRNDSSPSTGASVPERTFTAHLPQMPRPPHSAPSCMPALSRQSFRLVPASDWKRYRLPPANTSMFMMLMSAHPCCPNPFRKAKTEPGIACSKPLSISLRSRLPPWE